MYKGVLVLLVLLLIPLAIAQTEIYQESTELDLKQGCYNDGVQCNSSAVCIISVFDPDRLTLVNDENMTQHTTLAYFNYTLNTTQTEKVGEYEYRIICTQGDDSNFGTFNFLVTSSGNDPSLAEVATYGVLSLFLIFMFLLCVAGVIKLPRSNTVRDDGIIDVNYMKYTRQILFFMSYILLVGITYFAWQISENLIFLDVVTGFLSIMFYLLAYSMFPVFLVFMLFTIIMALNDKRVKKAMERGLPIR